jgi:mRNA interferase MazF
VMVLKKNNPLQGEIWLFDPDPVKGREIGKKVRPALVVSCNELNEGPSGLVIVVPMTSKDKGIPSHIRIDQHQAGIKVTSFAVCEQVRSVSKERFIKKLGKVQVHSILREVNSWLRDLLWVEI